MCDPNLVFKQLHLPAQRFVTSGLPTQNRIQQNFGEGEAHPKIYDPGGQPTGFEDPCRTLVAAAQLDTVERVHFPQLYSIIIHGFQKYIL